MSLIGLSFLPDPVKEMWLPCQELFGLIQELLTVWQDLYLYYFPTPSLSLSLSLLFQIDLYCLINDDSIHIYRQTRVVLYCYIIKV